MHQTQFSGAANQSVIWTGLDDSGNPAQPGIYFLRVESGSHSAVVRIALLR